MPRPFTKIDTLLGTAPLRGRAGARAFARGRYDLEWLSMKTGMSCWTLREMQTGLRRRPRWPSIEMARIIAAAMKCTEVELVEELAAMRVRWHLHCYTVHQSTGVDDQMKCGTPANPRQPPVIAAMQALADHKEE